MRSALALILALLAGCGVEADSAARATGGAPAGGRAGYAAVDDFGDTLRLGTAPRRIVSLNPATTEILFAIGAGDRLVGRTRWDVWPDSARLVPDLGDGLRPNVEAVLAARPDLVVLYASRDNADAARRLRAAGVPTLSLKVDGLDDFRRATRLLGAAVGDTARAMLVMDSVRRTLERVRTATRGLPRPTVVMPVWDRPLLVIGGRSYLTELIEIAGGRNAFADVAEPSPAVAREEVLRRDPDVLLVGPRHRERLLADPAWRGLRAVREGRVLAIDTALVQRPSVRIGEAAVALARLLHPGVVP